MPNDAASRMSSDAIPAPINRSALEQVIAQQGADFRNAITERHAHLFADAPVFTTEAHLQQMQAVIAAVEQVVALPAWLPERGDENCKGVFFGYDFHLNESGAHLIEVNTNAGGGFLNALLLQSQMQSGLPGRGVSEGSLDEAFIEMFRNEWRLVRGEQPLGLIAIVDEQPAEQYLYPEFILVQQMFASAGMTAVIADPLELSAQVDGLYWQGQKVDLIYNRLTDFVLDNYPALSNAYRSKHVVLTPSPLAYLRYADKRNLVRLTDAEALRALGASEGTISALQTGVPQTRLVDAVDAERWWNERKQWFFKPVSGYGAKGAYRGDKITKRVFDEILSGEYVAQKLAPPGERVLKVNGEDATLKFDVRCYVYDGQIQLVAARLYQGQTTNFRTPGGGFAVVKVLA